MAKRFKLLKLEEMIKILKSQKHAKMVTDMGIEKELTISPDCQTFQLKKQNLKHQNSKHKFLLNFRQIAKLKIFL